MTADIRIAPGSGDKQGGALHSRSAGRKRRRIIADEHVAAGIQSDHAELAFDRIDGQVFARRSDQDHSACFGGHVFFGFQTDLVSRMHDELQFLFVPHHIGRIDL